MTLKLCVLLWAAEGEDDALTAYEDVVLTLVPRHGGQVVSRVRRLSEGEGPCEVQIIELPDDGALQAYMVDPERLALASVQSRAIARTDILTVESLI